MKNPLHKRLPRQLKSEFGKYVVIFLLLIGSIGFISGFLVAAKSISKTYDESFKVYNIENGNFEMLSPLSDEAINEIENQEKISIYNNYYIEEDTDTNLNDKYDSTLRIFKDRKKVNKVCLMEGKKPDNKDEIAIDRMYANNNDVEVGDYIKVSDKKLKVTGFVALSDYSALFSNNGDLMFDAVKFGVAIMTDDGYNQFGDEHKFYSYSWKYDKEPSTEKKEKKVSDKLLEVIASKGIVKNFIPRYTNNAINFTGDDVGSDRGMMIALLYILIVIIAFIFAVTITNTINKEATIIGTLRASGYSKREITAHYMEIPLIVTIISAIIGNILGYTVFKYVCVGMYYGSYSLPTYTTVWSAEAFVLTTLVPFIIMLVVNYVFIRKKLRLSPMKFIRNDLSTSKKKKAIRLPHFKFFNRFRIRVIIQNRYNYLTLFVGIIFANLLLLFGLMLPALLDSYNDSIIEHMAAKYQYVLKTPLETETKDVEKYFMSTVEKTGDNGEKDDISVYGISDDSKYLSMDFESGKVYVSDVFADKYRLKKGDKFTLKESYGTKKHTFEIGGVYEYPIGLTIFMNKKDFCKEFNVKDNEFTGYFSNKKIKDIDQEYIYSVITQDDLTKMARQMDVSMGSMMNMVNIVSVLLSMLVMYLLIKLVIEKNSLSISMVKILGYDNNEIRKLYLTATTWVVIACVALSIPVVVWIIKDLIYRPMMMEMKGWIILKMDPIVYGEMFILGMMAYILVSFLEFRKIKKIPMTDALKNVE